MRWLRSREILAHWRGQNVVWPFWWLTESPVELEAVYKWLTKPAVLYEVAKFKNLIILKFLVFFDFFFIVILKLSTFKIFCYPLRPVIWKKHSQFVMSSHWIHLLFPSAGIGLLLREKKNYYSSTGRLLHDSQGGVLKIGDSKEGLGPLSLYVSLSYISFLRRFFLIPQLKLEPVFYFYLLGI